MKTKSLVLFAGLVALLFVLSGCASIPSGEFKDWTHDGNYGVFTSHYEAHGASKQPDGRILVSSYTGSIKVAGGYGPSDTITDLVIDPKTAPVSVPVLPSTAK